MRPLGIVLVALLHRAWQIVDNVTNGKASATRGAKRREAPSPSETR
jgi:hypothetical protein